MTVGLKSISPNEFNEHKWYENPKVLFDGPATG